MREESKTWAEGVKGKTTSAPRCTETGGRKGEKEAGQV